MAIKADALIEKFRYALDNHYGYIYGAAGVMWTAAKQQQKVNYMVSKYGTSWKKNSEAKNDNYYNAAVYGSKWIGHYVADCSGMFVWAFKQLGGPGIAHGSNSIYDRYCSKKGKLTDDKKKTLMPGTAVFTGDASQHGHIGLYVGNGKCIEASGTQAGVCTSNLSAGKWTYYGELKDVAFTDEAPAYTQVPSEKVQDERPTIRKGDKGIAVRLAQTILDRLGYDLGSCGIDGDFGKATEKAVKEFQDDHKLSKDGVVGPKTWAALIAADDQVLGQKEKTYTVCIHGLDKTQATALQNNYPGATATEE